MNARGRDALALEISHRVLLGGKEQVRDLIDDDAVNFLGHRAVEAAQARFDVHDRNKLLRRDQRRRQRRVDVADDDNRVRLHLVHHRLQRKHQARCLHGVARRADAEEGVGLRHGEIVEQDVVHGGVVVLTRMNEARIEARVACEGAQQRGDLHHVGARACDADDAIATRP